MAILRISAAPAGRLGDRMIPWAIFGGRSDMRDGLEESALAGERLAEISPDADGEMFDPDSPLGDHLAEQAVGDDPDAPVVVFVNGFGCEPRRPVVARCRSDNPHRTIYHFEETPDGPGSAEERRLHLTPWFARAMLAEGRGAASECQGLAVGYAYASRGGSDLPFLPDRWTRRLLEHGVTQPWREPALPYVNAYQDAEVAGHGLAALLSQLRQRLDDEEIGAKPIDLFCHGLGARTAMAALEMLARRAPRDGTLQRIGRVVLVNGACYWGQAASALAAITFADTGTDLQFYNIMSRTDDVLHYLASRSAMAGAVDRAVDDLCLDEKARRVLAGGRTIGRHGTPPTMLYDFCGSAWSGWIDLPLDNRRTRRWGHRRGFDVRGQTRFGRGDHWLCLSHPGNWDLYRSILHRAPGTEVRELSAELYQQRRHPGRSGKSARAA